MRWKTQNLEELIHGRSSRLVVKGLNVWIARVSDSALTVTRIQRGPGARSWFVFDTLQGPHGLIFVCQFHARKRFWFCYRIYAFSFSVIVELTLKMRFFLLLLPFRSWTLFVLNWKVMTFFVLFLSVKKERDYDRWRKLRSVSGGQIYRRLLWFEVNEFEFLNRCFPL